MNICNLFTARAVAGLYVIDKINACTYKKSGGMYGNYKMYKKIQKALDNFSFVYYNMCIIIHGGKNHEQRKY